MTEEINTTGEPTPEAPPMLNDLDLSWLQDAVDTIVSEDRTALQLYCWAKRLEKRAKEIQQTLVAAANVEFAAVQRTSAKETKWPVEDFAVLTLNSPTGSWAYTPDIISKQQLLDEAIKAFKSANKDTHYTRGKLDPAKDVLFKVTIMR